MKGSHHILILFEIYPCLSPYTAVHLSQKCSRDLDKINSPKVGGSCKAGHISHNAAPKGRQKIFPVKVVLDQKLVDSLDLFQIFIFFSCGKDIRINFPSVFFKLMLYVLQIERSHMTVRHDTESLSLIRQSLYFLR